jgi:flagellar motor switch protein FliN/FliY
MNTDMDEVKSAGVQGGSAPVAHVQEGGNRPKTDPSVMARPASFPELTDDGTNGAGLGSLGNLMDVSVTVTAELGRIKRSIGSILKLGVGSVLDLDRGMTEHVDLLVQGTLLARGEVVIVEDRFAIRIKEIVDPKLATKK